ncbi:AsmA family protein [Roseibium algae]|uniref:AsmA-like C-terminal region-containing protein n=1 Tax=Roseibium algae TaxID=3123038 RepID=A0ABU8TKL6_9HYPH
MAWKLWRTDLNSVYITFGVAVILVLITALVGPFFVDWTVYRSTFERYAEQALGHKVRVLGDADIRLLPSPTVTFFDVRVGEAEDPLLVVSKFQMRVELPPLLKGEIHVLDMQLERPHLSVSLDEAGRLDWLTGMKGGRITSDFASEDVAFENITVVDGAISLVHARTGETHQIDDGNFQVSARTLVGPFKIDGSLTYGDEPYSVRLATGKQQDTGGIRLKGSVTPTMLPVELSVDGLLSHTDKAPILEGGFKLVSIMPEAQPDKAWRASGDFNATVSSIEIPKFEYRLGPEDRLLGLDGNAKVVLDGERRFEVRATAKQIDLDRLYGGGPQAPVDLAVAGQEILSTLQALPVPEMDGVIALDVPAVVLGGSLAQDIRLDLETMVGGWRIARFAGRAPGRTVIATQGDLAISGSPSYRGNLSISSEQPGAFSAWLRQSGKGSSNIQPVSLEGHLNIVPSGAALDNFRLTLADAQAKGSLAYRKPRNGNDEFSLSLNAESLDLDELERLAKLFGRSLETSDGLDVSLRVQAKQVSIRDVAGKGLSLEAEYSGTGLRIDRLYAEDLAGAQIDISGRIDDLLTAPVGALSGTLDARDLGGVVALLRGVLPESSVLERLEQASDYLVPARFQADLKAAAVGDASDLTFVLDGIVGGVGAKISNHFKGRVDAWEKAAVEFDLDLTGPDGGQILRQLGFDILPVDDLGQGTVAITARGRPEDGLDISVSANTGSASVGALGQVRLTDSGEPRYSLAVTASAPDLAPFALLSGRVMPVMAGDIDMDLQLNLAGTGSKITASDLAGTVAGVTVDGSLAGDLKAVVGEENRRFKGKLHLGSLDMRSLSEAILGPDQWFSAGDGSSIWPTGAFGAPLFSDTDLTLDLSADILDVGDGHLLEGMQSELRLTPTMLRLDGLSGNYGGGKVSGVLAFRRSGAEGSVSGHLKLEDAALQSLVWTHNDRAVATGDLNVVLDFEGAGRSIAVMASGLTGGGTFAVTNGELRGINPQAFDLVIRAADAGLDLRDEKIQDVFTSYMEAGNLAFDRLEGSVSIVGGRASARNVAVDTKRAEVFGSAEADFNTWEMDSDFSLTVDPGEDAVTGAEPRVGVLFSGPLDAPERRLDITPFTAYLTLRAFEQEVERVEKLQAEILERDRLFREMKRQKEQRVRREREAAEKAAAREKATQRLEETLNKAKDAGSPPDVPANDNQVEQQTKSSATGSFETPADFASGIRSVIESPAEVNLPDATGAIAREAEPAALPPLDAPRSVEDILAREIGQPADALGRQPILVEPRTTTPRETGLQTSEQAKPRYRTLPNGLVIEIKPN